MAIVWMLVICAGIGHAALAIAAINRIHSTATPRWILEWFDWIWYLAVLFPAIVALAVLRSVGFQRAEFFAHPIGQGLGIYAAICSLIAILAGFLRIGILRRLAATPCQISNHTILVNLANDLEIRRGCSRVTRALASLPGNEVFSISVVRKELQLARLPQSLDGLTITHLSDLHLTGQLPIAFYRRIADLSNQLGSDLVAVTGDIVEKRPCLAWLPESLGKICAPLGVHFVLGNHELRIHDSPLIRQKLRDIGWSDLGSSFRTIEHRDSAFLLAGNELPWHTPAADMASATVRFNDQHLFRIVLSHAPDQLRWAQDWDIDLMLAGHTHGGQIRLPIVGPIFSPSRFGVKYASGVFCEPPTLLHVSRGIAGTRPLRYHCSPEIVQLILRSGSRESQATRLQ